MTVDFEGKSLYLIQEGRVINKASGAENISEGIRILAGELGDTAMKVLSRFESGDNDIGVVVNTSEIVDDDGKVFIISLNQPLNEGDEVSETTDDDLTGRTVKYN